MANQLFFRYSDHTKLKMSDKLTTYLQKFRDKFGTNPDTIYLNGVHENEIGNSFLDLPVKYKSTLNLNELDFQFPDGFMPSQSV